MNRLLLHADDFGLNEAVTHGVIDGFSTGLLTSTSLLTNAPAAKLAADEWRRLEQARMSGKLPSAGLRRRLEDLDAPFDLGIHLNLTQGRPLTGGRFPSDFLDADGQFLAPGRLFLKLLVGGGSRWWPALYQELSAQIGWLLDHGLRPTHLNGHQYVEMMPVVSDLIPQLARQYAVRSVRAACEPGHLSTALWPGVRLANAGLSIVKHGYAVRFRRALDAAGIHHADAYFGASQAGRIDLPLVQRFLRLARSYSVSEIALHPGQSPSFVENCLSTDVWHDPLTVARHSELQLLCSPVFAELLAKAHFGLTRFFRPAARRVPVIASVGKTETNLV